MRLRIILKCAVRSALVSVLVNVHVIFEVHDQCHVSVGHDGSFLLAILFVVPLVPVRYAIVVLHKLQLPVNLGRPNEHAVVSIVEDVRFRVEDPAVLLVLVAKPYVIAVGHPHCMDTHNDNSLFSIKVEVLLEEVKQFMGRKVVLAHWNIGPTHATRTRAMTILAAEVPHGKMQSLRARPEHRHVRGHECGERPDIGPRVAAPELFDYVRDRFDRLFESLVIGVVQIDAAVAPAHAVVEAEPQKLGDELPLGVVDQLGNLGTNIVDVSLVVAVVVPAVGLPSTHGPAGSVDGFGWCHPPVAFPAIVGPFAKIDGFAAAGGAAAAAALARLPTAAAAAGGARPAIIFPGAGAFPDPVPAMTGRAGAALAPLGSARLARFSTAAAARAGVPSAPTMPSPVAMISPFWATPIVATATAASLSGLGAAALAGLAGTAAALAGFARGRGG
mmetsp:Transcript_1395/g.3530  ORF Transcript_1395/g.3530 Transcript_1395/m.3530 type:complete len:445 (+) Transcript_1395:265-1599(+)